MFTKQTIRDTDCAGKTVLVRADYNVPVKDGVITDDFRITQSLPTLNYLLDQGAKVVIISHLGRPSGPNDTASSLFPVVKRLEQLLDRPVGFATDCIGEIAQTAIHKLQNGEVVLLENLRFHPEEEQNNPEFAKALAESCDVFVEDGFGVVHRAHASTEGVTHWLPSVAGLLLEREVDTITKVMEDPKRPLMAIIGGAKITDKIEILHRFLEIADVIAIGGAMANTFLAATGRDVAASLFDAADVPIAKDIIRKAGAQSKKRPFVFFIPHDVVVATAITPEAHTRIVDWTANVYADITAYPKRPSHASGHLLAGEKILDIGPFSGSFIAGAIQLSQTVVWNGTMGVTEVSGLQGPVGPFSHGTQLLVSALLGEFGHKPFTVVGGGDTVGYVENNNLVDLFGHVSTGGGASLELMAGHVLPGVAALLDRES